MYNHNLLVKHGLKTCAKCLDDWPIEAFGFDRSRPDGRAVYCKRCRVKKRKYWIKFYYHECPVCGRGKEYRERQYTAKPEDLQDRHAYVEHYDYCLEY